MLKLLVENGAEITSETISKEENVNNFEILSYLIDNGGDPNSENGLPIRQVIKGVQTKDGKVYHTDCLELLLKSGGDPRSRNMMGARMVLECGNNDIIKMIYDFLNETYSISEELLTTSFDWLVTAEKGKVAVDEVIELVIDLLKGYGRTELVDWVIKNYKK